ncbi:MAG: sodium:calcium antiporter [Rhodospirillales bacterium]|nr:sodium:calcium antiporter [Rhodospirillales bacterium]
MVTTALTPWLEFAVCTALLGFAGPVLTRYGDVIARLTGLSRSWVGLALLATATSLPELFTGISSVAVADTPNIAVGDALGSCVFNLVMLVLLDELSRREPMYRHIDQGHILTAGFGVILIGAVGAFLLLSHSALAFPILHISGYTPLIFVIYFMAVRSAFTYERRLRPARDVSGANGEPSLRVALLWYSFAAGIVIIAGAWLPFVGRGISATMGWKTTFVGSLFIAGATSAPELIVTVSALRLGAVDLAIGNLLGSNLFDIVILAVDDLAYRKGVLFEAVSTSHAVTAFAAAIMSGIFIVATLYKPETRLGGAISWASLSLLVVYLFSAYVVFFVGS